MKYRWQQFIDGNWQPVNASELPDWLKKKKAVLFASRGIELTRDNRSGVAERYRMIKHTDPTAG